MMADIEPRDAIVAVRDEVAKIIVGQEGIVTGVLTALLVQGHVLLEGVPGVAKTLLVTTIARALDLESTRIQFTPDLMPSDITGQLTLTPSGSFEFRRGPVFTNLLVADELNRTPPKTQAALLESMEERQVSQAGETHRLPNPFIVVATQNPIEYEGTYPLPRPNSIAFCSSSTSNTHPRHRRSTSSGCTIVGPTSAALWRPRSRRSQVRLI